jgi:hypothetical protein
MPAVMPDTPPRARPAPFQQEYAVGATPTMPDMQVSHMRRDYPVGPMPDMRMRDYSDMRIDSFRPPYQPPVEATRAVMPEPNYSGGLGSLFGGMSGSVSYPSSPSPSGFGPLQQQNPQLLEQMQGAEIEKQRKAADLQRLRSQPYDPRQLIG